MKNLSFGKVLVFVLGLLLGSWIILTGVFGWMTRSQVPAMVQSFNQQLAHSEFSAIQVSAELKSAGFFTSEYQVSVVAAPDSMAHRYLAQLPSTVTLSVEHGPVLGLLSRSPVQFGWANVRTILPQEMLGGSFELFAQKAFPFGAPRNQIDIGTFQQRWVMNTLNQQQKMQVFYLIQETNLPDAEKAKLLSQLAQMRFLPTDYDKTVISLPNARISLHYDSNLAAEISLPVLGIYEKNIQHDLLTALENNLPQPPKALTMIGQTELRNVVQRLELQINEKNLNWLLTSRVGSLELQKDIVDPAGAGVFNQTLTVSNSDQHLQVAHKDGADTLAFGSAMDHFIGENWLLGNGLIEFKNVNIQGKLTGFEFEMLKRASLENVLNAIFSMQSDTSVSSLFDVKALAAAQVNYSLNGQGVVPQRSSSAALQKSSQEHPSTQTGAFSVSLRNQIKPTEAQENTNVLNFLHPLGERTQQFDASFAIERGLVESYLSVLLSAGQPGMQIPDHTMAKLVDVALEKLPLQKNANNQITLDMQLIPDAHILKLNDKVFTGQEEIQSLLGQIDLLMQTVFNIQDVQ